MQDDKAQSDDQSRHNGVILEDIQDKLARVLEATDALRDVPTRIQSIDERLINVEADVKTIKAAVTDTSRQVKDHDVRLTHLEQAA